MSELESRSLDRRQLLKAGAWAAPVVLLATASPAAAGSIPPIPVVTVVADCTETTGQYTNHGFTVKNTSTTETAVVIVGFIATARGIGQQLADENVKSVTTSPSALYPVDATPGAGLVPTWTTYRTIWSDSVISRPAGSLRWQAKRNGTATFTLPPGGSVRIGQLNLNALGQPTVVATVVSVNDSTPDSPATAQLSFELGGGCTAQ